MTIPGAHLQMVSNQCTYFQKKPCSNQLEHAWTKSCPKKGVRQTEIQTDRPTYSVKPIYLLRLQGYKNSICICSDITDFLSDGLLFAYEQAHHRLNIYEKWPKKWKTTTNTITINKQYTDTHTQKYTQFNPLLSSCSSHLTFPLYKTNTDTQKAFQLLF